jgi:3,4-dihydroxy 2-butanone 4-phosphate synthase/GTP cyclohydrolase II
MNSIEDIIEDIRQGKMVILVDDESRENEGDLILASDFVTAPLINFMAREARGLICLALTSEQISRLGLPQMVSDDLNLSPNRTAFTVSIEASHGVSTGISAADRAHTVRVASNPKAVPQDIIAPGHIFPIKAQKGGVLKRAGHTEASVDLARLAGLNPAAVICEVMNDDGSMARVDDLKAFAKKHDIKIGTIEDLIEYRLAKESFVEREFFQTIDTAYGTGFSIQGFRNKIDNRLHVAIVKGDLTTDEPALVRVQTENILTDVLGVLGTAQEPAVASAMKMIEKAGRGALLYLRNDERQSFHSLDKRPMDDKDYGIGAQILRALGLSKIILLSNHAIKRAGIKGYGIEIVDAVSFDGTSLGYGAENEL